MREAETERYGKIDRKREKKKRIKVEQISYVQINII